MDNLAERIVMYRAVNRLSQADMAKRCGVSAQTIHNIESGYQTPTRLTRAKILLVIGEQKHED